MEGQILTGKALDGRTLTSRAAKEAYEDQRRANDRKDLDKFINNTAQYIASDSIEQALRNRRFAELFAKQVGEDLAEVNDKIKLKAISYALMFEENAAEDPGNGWGSPVYHHSKQHFRDIAKKIGTERGVFSDLKLNHKMITATQRLEKIVGIARDKMTKIADAANPQSNYDQIQRELTKYYKAIQWYASQRNDLGKNEDYLNYCTDSFDIMDTINAKIKGVQTK
jgi:hypothetical protein